MPKQVAIADTKEISKLIVNPHVTRVVFSLTGMDEWISNNNFAFFILLFIHIKFNWITNKAVYTRVQGIQIYKVCLIKTV